MTIFVNPKALFEIIFRKKAYLEMFYDLFPKHLMKFSNKTFHVNSVNKDLCLLL